MGREENDYDGDESEMSYSHIKRGRRSIKKKQPPNSAPMRTGIPLSLFAHKASDSDDKEIVHSNKPCDSSDSAAKDRLEAERRLKEEKQREEDERKRMEEERIKQEKELKRLEEEKKQKEIERKKKEEEARLEKERLAREEAEKGKERKKLKRNGCSWKKRIKERRRS